MLYIGEHEVQAENDVNLTSLLIFFACTLVICQGHYFCLVSIPHNGMHELVLKRNMKETSKIDTKLKWSSLMEVGWLMRHKL